jgi:hypothetical protein
MNRRTFVKSAVSIGAVSLITLPEIGCVNQSELASLAQTLGSASANIATLEGNTALATQITTETNTAVSAITSWKSGTPTNEIIEAIGILESTISLFPTIGSYAPLIDIALATIQTILAMLPPATITPTTPVNARMVRHVYMSPVPKNTASFKKQWNAAVMADSKISPKAEIK